MSDEQVVRTKARAIQQQLYYERFFITNNDEAKTAVEAYDLNGYTPFTNLPNEAKVELVTQTRETEQGNRAMGALVGGAVGDSVGAPVEFLWAGNLPSPPKEVASNKDNIWGPYVSLQQGELCYSTESNKFGLQRGQWTDDTAMGLCLADSLLDKGAFDGSDLRIRFHCWWNRGYNNAFRKEKERFHSVGLGGNIANSLYCLEPDKPVPPYYDVDGEDSGNGSLMRLAAVPIFYHNQISEAMRVGALQSKTTHPGTTAEEACRFMSFLIAKAIASEDGPLEARSFLDSSCEEYIDQLEGDSVGVERVRALLVKGGNKDKEQVWNWRDEELQIDNTLKHRGHNYNGYPVTAGYFGSYCMDGLAMALHAVYHTTSFDAAVLCVINMLGDADTTGAIAGQIAGAIYGYNNIHPTFITNLNKWDDNEIASRAALLWAKNATS